MENKQIVSAAGTEDNSTMKPADQRAHPKGRSDIMTRRLKNRERQRRYRLRKRLEAERLEVEIKKTSVVEETTPMRIELQSNGNHNNFMTRIYCKRDWKKDARRAHALKHQEITPNGSIDPSTTLTTEPKLTCLASGNRTETMLEWGIQSGSSSVVNSETPKMVLSRRDWKAEARRKKD